MKKLILTFTLLFSAFSHSISNEEIRNEYNQILDGIVNHFENTNTFYDVCTSWELAVLLATQLNTDTMVDDINLIVLVDILNNFEYHNSAKVQIQSEFNHFKKYCQPEKDPLNSNTLSLF